MLYRMTIYEYCNLKLVFYTQQELEQYLLRMLIKNEQIIA